MAFIVLSKLNFSSVGGTGKGEYGSKSGNENCGKVVEV